MTAGEPERQNKRPLSQECTFDRIVLDRLGRVQPVLRRWGLTPNDLTSASLMAGLGAVYALWRENLPAFAILFIVSYVADCADGQHARRYRMETRFGDWYDHGSDVLVLVLVVTVAWVRWRKRLRPWHAVVPVLLLFVVLLAFGCQQAGRGAGEPRPVETLDSLQGLFGVSAQPPRWLRCFGTGHCMLLFVWYICWLGVRHHRGNHV